mgnify:CR=1 FL=1
MKKEYKRPSSAFKNAELESIIALSLNRSQEADPTSEVLSGFRDGAGHESSEEYPKGSWDDNGLW